MLAVPNCYKRNCKHFLGVSQTKEKEAGEVVVCLAFSEGIPEEISYGDNLHLKPLKDQDNDIVYERED